MTRVFISGSRSIRELSPETMESLDKIIALRMRVLIGDCYGADALVQQYLGKHDYVKNVVVHYVGDRPRVWDKRMLLTHCPPRADVRHFEAKDVVMAGEADYGLVLLDGQSQGSQNNTLRMKQRNVPFKVHRY